MNKRMVKPKSENVHAVMHRLDPEQKLVLSNCLKSFKGRTEMHPGLLSFVSLTEAREAMMAATIQHPRSKILRRVMLAIMAIRSNETVSFRMHLNDGKVAKRFGRHPELGKMLPSKTRVTVGVRWSLPRKDYEPDDDVLVNHTMALKPIKKGLWLVSVHKKLREQAELWLLDYCR